MKIEKETQIEEKWDKRILCIDESCIGVIGSDGRCRVCGTPLTKDNLSIKIQQEEITETESESNENEITDIDVVVNDWENRVLCQDESCIGVIGAKGMCRVCEKPFIDD